MQKAECCTPHHASRFTRHLSRGFSLIEILVTVALLSFIILGLFAMFHQTQRAFTSSMTQTDVLESGRVVTDMLARELEQLTPSGRNAVNFYAQIPNATPLTQSLPGTTSGNPITRTYYLEDFFVLTRQNQTWTGIGYCVRNSDASGQLWPAEIAPGRAGVGSLYRYTASTNVLQANGLPSDPNQLYVNFLRACVPGSVASRAISNRICDGVVHLHLRAFATNGFPLFSSGSGTNAFFLVRTNGPNFGYSFLRQASAVPNAACPDRLGSLYSWSNAVPAYLELELGVLESRTLARYNSISDPTARRNYFQRDDNSTRVHLFHQRVPVRNVDPAAFQ
jgi:prepilin-type N-terminal cleavage/methylation domain-containing protein